MILAIPPFSSEHGYGVLQRGRGKAKLKVIQLAVWSKAEQLCEHGSNTSHLCATPMCMRPEHLVIETCGKNNRRVGIVHAGRLCLTRIISSDSWYVLMILLCLRPDEKGLRDKHRVHDPSVTHGWREMTEEEVIRPYPLREVRVKYKQEVVGTRLFHKRQQCRCFILVHSSCICQIQHIRPKRKFR